SYIRLQPAAVLVVAAGHFPRGSCHMILTFGSVNADFIIRVPKLPQPGETVLGGSYELLPGGKGANQALAARRAGAEVTFAGAVDRPRAVAGNRPPCRERDRSRNIVV